MKLLITKFIKNETLTNIYKPFNYFTSDGIDVVDYITINKIPVDGIPVFNEELTRPDEPMQFKCGDYDVKLSMLDDTLSNLGKSISEFFTLDKKYIIRVIVENNDVLKSFGFIDISSISFNRNISDKGSSSTSLTISFTVYSGELEWYNYAISKKFGEFAYINQGSHGTWDENDLSFGEFMSYFLSDLNVIMDNRTNFDALVLQKSSFTPKTSPLQKIFTDESYWQIFQDILKGYGIMYKLVPNETYCTIDQWGKPNAILFFRAGGIDINELQILDRVDGMAVNFDKETFMLLYSKYKNSPGADAKYEGFIDNIDSRCDGGIYCFNINDVFNVYDGWDILFYRNAVQEYMFRDKSTVADAGLKLIGWGYDNFGKWGDGNDEKNYVSAARFFVQSYSYVIPLYGTYYDYSDSGFQQITESILPHVYDFTIASLKKSMTLKIVNNDLFDTSVYNRVSFGGTDFWIEKVYDSDLNERTAKVKIVEV